MALEQRTTPYGEPAFLALRAAIDDLQAGDPLRPVTVLVHSNAVGVAARRWLASHGGIAAAQFLTTFRFAELLGGPVLAASQRRPLSTPVIDVAVRRALAHSPGMLGSIAHHRATVAGLRDAHRELRHLPPATVERIGRHGSARARDIIRLHLAVQEALRTDWYDEADLLRAACGATAEAPDDTVVFLPQRRRPTEEALLRALGQHGRTIVLEGVAQPPQVPLRLVDASDADEEAREAVRLVLAAARDGVPLHRIGIAWPRHEPYARLVAEHLTDAGIQWNGRPGVAQHERLAARLVLDVLRLDRRGIRRADLFALLSHVPARTADGENVPRQLWERVSRDAGVAGDGDWSRKLPAYAEQQEGRGRAREAEGARSLLRFVDHLREVLGAPAATATWQQWSSTAHGLMSRWLGGHRGIQALPPAEFEGHSAVEAALDRLARLDDLADPCTREVFADTLEAELTSAPGRVGRIGVGVQVGPLSFAVGQPFEHLVVVGACDGLLPAAPPSESLLGDADRALADGGLPLGADSPQEQQHQLWAAMAGAAQVTVVTPRGDLRATATRHRSRWIDELAGTSPAVRTVPSFAAGLADAAFPTTATHHRVRALTHAARLGSDLLHHPLVDADPALRRAVVMVRARESAVLTEFDGDLTGLHIDPLGPGPVSPTRLEAFPSCPHGWFVRFVLGVEPVEQPDEQLQIAAKDRGTLVHDALDAFHRQVIDGVLPQPGPTGWTEQHAAALRAAFDAKAAELELLGSTGRTAFWRSEQARQHHELGEWLRRDGDLAVQRGATVMASEHRFGSGDVPPALIRLPDGTDIVLKGSVDRIDRCRDGSLVVTDHKTGSRRGYGDVTDADPTAGGTKVQLAAYAAAALAHAQAPEGTPVHAEYGFFAREDFQRVGVDIGPANWPTIADRLQRLLAEIRTGLFYALPEKSQFRLSFVPCEYCDPDHLGTADAYRRTLRKVLGDPRLAHLRPDTPEEPVDG